MQYDWCPYKKQGTDRHTQGGCREKMQAEVEVMRLQAKGHRGFPATSGSAARATESPPQSLRKGPALPTPGFALPAHRTVKGHIPVI